MKKVLIYGCCFGLATIFYVLLFIYFFPQVPVSSRQAVAATCYLGFVAAALSCARAIERRNR